MSRLQSILLPALPKGAAATVSTQRTDCGPQCSHPVFYVTKGRHLHTYRLPSARVWKLKPLLHPSNLSLFPLHQSQKAAQHRPLRVRATQEGKVFEIEPLSKTLVDGPYLDKGEFYSVPVVVCEPEPEEALPELVRSVLENFHEDTEPWFFRESGRGPSYKKIDLDARKQGVGSETDPLIEGNGALLDMQSNMPPGVQSDFALGHALLAAEAQVAGSMAEWADQKARLAPVVASHFRALGESKDDVHYPDFFEGYWEVDAVLICMDVPKGIDNLMAPVQLYLRDMVDKHHKHIRRYIKHNGKVIGDRLYNEMSLDAVSEGNMLGVWDPNRPGTWRVCTTSPEHGDRFESQNDYNVSLRAFDSGPGSFDCSEFTREWTVHGMSTWPADLPPDISASFFYHRYKWDPKQKDGPDEMTSIMRKSEFRPWMEYCGNIPPTHDFLLKMLSQTTEATFIEKMVLRHRRIDDPHTEESEERGPGKSRT